MESAKPIFQGNAHANSVAVLHDFLPGCDAAKAQSDYEENVEDGRANDGAKTYVILSLTSGTNITARCPTRLGACQQALQNCWQPKLTGTCVCSVWGYGCANDGRKELGR